MSVLLTFFSRKSDWYLCKDNSVTFKVSSYSDLNLLKCVLELSFFQRIFILPMLEVEFMKN